MKIKVSRQELNECLNNVMRRIIEEGKDKKNKGFEKATKKANREMEKDVFGDGFKSYDKVHKSSKEYSRKGKNKKNYFEDERELNEDVIDMSTNPVYPNETNKDMGEWGEADNFVDYITIKTDIDPIEKELIDKIRNNFSENEVEIDNDTDSGYKTFNVTKSDELINRFIEFLNDNDVNIIK